MRMKHFLIVGVASAALCGSAWAAEPGIGGPMPPTGPGTTTNAPDTGASGTAVPEMAPGSSGAMGTSPNGSMGTTGTGSKDGGASSTDLQHQLTTRGYKNITPTGTGGATNSGNTRFLATNPAGNKVMVTVNSNTGAIVSEMPSE